jgi:mxaK protein
MRHRTVHASFGAVAAVCAAIAIWYGVQLTQANRINAAIASANATPIEAATSGPATDGGSATSSGATTDSGPAASSGGTPSSSLTASSGATPSSSFAASSGATLPISSPAAPSTVPQAQLAHAIALAKAGKFTAALKAYKALLDAPDEVRLPALYNLGNLNMREALKNGQGEAQRALPLIELAKQSYRDDLRSNPADWDARYNLERALWLSPEYDDPILERNQAPVHSEHAMSTLQGAKIDLP